MKGVPVKFRGVRIDGNGYAYGDLEHRYNGREIWIDGWQVRPATVAQLCGYDADDNELYEGDEVTLTIEDGVNASGKVAAMAGAVNNAFYVAYGFEDCAGEFAPFKDLAKYVIRIKEGLK